MDARSAILIQNLECAHKRAHTREPGINVTFDLNDWELVWPRAVLTTELGALLTAPDDEHWNDRCHLLLREAFTRRALRAVEGLSVAECKTLLGNVAWATSSLPLASEHRPYYSARVGIEHPPWTEPELRSTAFELLRRLQLDGYFEQAIPNSTIECVETTRHIDLELQRKLNLPSLWQLAPLNWYGATFFDVIEVFHDMVARPRLAWYDATQVSWLVGDFSKEAGQALYRFWINDLFGQSTLSYCLAGSGDDTGRLVLAASDVEHEFLEEMAARSDRETGDEVRHAVASFRARGASREERRSAVIALVRILESRRSLLHASLSRRDERALFEIANKFDIRHRNGLQNDDYDEVFLDWIFRWYLATIKLTDDLIGRDSAS